MWSRYQAGDSQSGAGADDQARSVGAGLARLDLDQRIGFEVGHAQGLSREIIDQLEPLEAERLLQLAVRKDPGTVGELDTIRVDGAGKGQARFLRCGLGIEPNLAQIAAYRLYRTGVLGGGRGKDQIGRAPSELQSRGHLVCRLLLEKKKRTQWSRRIATERP